MQVYIYYYDWGPNSGTNWMMGDVVGSSFRIMESFNIENNATECLVNDFEVKWRNVNNGDESLDGFSMKCL